MDRREEVSANIDAELLNSMLQGELPANQPRFIRESVRRLDVIDAGLLNIRVGEVLAADPFRVWNSEIEGFRLRFPTGRYQVRLVVADTRRGGRRCALAQLVLRDRRIARCEYADCLTEDWDELEPGRFLGFGVDSGTAAFFDRSAVKYLVELANQESKADAALLDALQRSRRQGFQWANFPLSTGADNANIVAFDSGWGDGLYGTYATFDVEGLFCGFVIDFSVMNVIRAP